MDLEITQLSRNSSDTQEGESFIFFLLISLRIIPRIGRNVRIQQVKYNLYIIHTVESP